MRSVIKFIGVLDSATC